MVKTTAGRGGIAPWGCEGEVQGMSCFAKYISVDSLMQEMAKEAEDTRRVCIEEGRENEFIHIAEGLLEAQHCINTVALRENMARQAKTKYSEWSNDDIKCAIAHVLDDTQGEVWFKHEFMMEVFKRIPNTEKEIK